ncbi:uncharacterized protein LOC118736435 [Rhagoletis pomonella]|uniref:uncharacterized protein LOC118736435 n=1 Tax=Rhagoletis pomonella TaxID=28610 RepID=UPI00177DB996|nr:uncharacterized protein LOC118736435 [Rhagoletis pomonella]
MSLRKARAYLTIGLQLLSVLTVIKQVTPTIRLNNIRCQSRNTSIIQIDYCHIKAVRRDFKEVSFKLCVLKRPIRKAMINVKFLKRTNGYKPFMRDMKVDACSYLKKRNNFILNALMNVVEKSSNMNHTCPYDHDLIVEKLHFTDIDFRWIPFPHGDYAFQTDFVFDGVEAAQMELFLSIMN